MLNAFREMVKDVLSEAFPTMNVYSYEPERPVPSCIIIKPAPSFVRVEDSSYGMQGTFNWILQPIVKVAVNQIETSNLDTLIMDIIHNIWQQENVTTIEVDKPFIVELNGANYLSTYINIQVYSQGGI